ncbi:NAD+ synthase [Mycoplasma testudineum]|uniref:NH(3)-dependent NAD(+) synthetase n=1 Tax=Mycoplasma testudineum TaxID=244584 RepID=A0A4R6IDV9_9MOLU|nr:NAD(+) synthase [Mycoplasma testudineum]OYD26710.1 NAD(+) synthase [Mycoplasma testudineum]TDO19841.1 NAD+ synthase [Mycoplasma testudineum]
MIFDKIEPILTLNELIEYGEYVETWLKDQVKQSNKKGVIVGLSGGIDSALVAAISNKVFGKNCHTISMMINPRLEDEKDINELVKQLNLNHEYINLLDSFETIEKKLNLSNKLAIANIKPRLRMLTLYAKAQELDLLVLGTDNLDEAYLGYFTKYGDGAADLLPIVRLTKSEVRQLSKYYGVTDSIINKAPSAGLWENQTDEDEMGISYNQVDDFLRNNSIDATAKERINHLHKISEHKRIPIPKPNHLPEFILKLRSK